MRLRLRQHQVRTFLEPLSDSSQRKQSRPDLNHIIPHTRPSLDRLTHFWIISSPDLSRYMRDLVSPTFASSHIDLTIDIE